ncbi:MAG TPA: N-6 DNA methylase [Candidatus Cloacimonetes bacterium]|nr:N-6 DNA methylase [Candidatus Cloacimonadota bacterium]
MIKDNQALSHIHSEGSLLSRDFLLKLLSGNGAIPAFLPKDYRLSAGERLNEAATRSYARLSRLWKSFQAHLKTLPPENSGTTETRSMWLIPLFQELGYGSLQSIRGESIEGKSYPQSHEAQEPLALHLMSHKWDLDRRPRSARDNSFLLSGSPFSLMQEYLNRNQKKLWGILTNGNSLRLMRNNASLTRSSYLGFDLKAIFDSDSYADFFLLWLICHQSRFAVSLDEFNYPLPAETCIMESWYLGSISEGVRAMEELRDKVENSISILGKGFISHSANNELRRALSSGELSPTDFYHQLLRLVYRMIFIFVAEDRELLLLPDTSAKKRELYEKYYSSLPLRYLARRQRGGKAHDLWLQLSLIFSSLYHGNPDLGIPALGSFLFKTDPALINSRLNKKFPEYTRERKLLSTPHLDSALIDNRSLLSAFRELCYIQKNRSYQMISYKNLGSEELGSVYESLLELQPEMEIAAGYFSLKSISGHQRKTTASYYTPTSLVNSLLDSALLPLINDIMQNSEEPEADLLKLKVCDPSCGSGHFLIAAAQLIASFVANIRAGEDSPSAIEKQKALRDVISSCIYGVDLNPMAVELCKISLWMEAIEPGKPLNFLDHRILCGNSLLGTTPELLYAGIPNNAFTALEGDDPELIKVFRRENRETVDQLDIFGGYDTGHVLDLQAGYDEETNFYQISEDSLSDIETKAELYREHTQSELYERRRLPYDAWCAAFLWHIQPNGITPILNSTLTTILDNPENISDEQRKEVKRIAEEYKFFHWHLAFPDVFPTEINEEDNTVYIKDGVGFDCVLGNPPWERAKLQEKEFFAGHSDTIVNARNAAARRRLIQALPQEDPILHKLYTSAKRTSEGISLMLHNSGSFPLCGRGDINYYTVFAELNRNLLSNIGRTGFIVPTGIATDFSTRFFFEDAVNSNSLVSLYDFENRKKIFPAVDSRMKFSLLTIKSASDKTLLADMLFFAQDVADLKDENKRFNLSPDDFALLNPNTKTCPIFRNKAQAELAKYIYRRLPILINENKNQEGNPWDISFMRMFDMTNDSHLFKTKANLEASGAKLRGNIFFGESTRYLPLYEAKMIHHYNHRFGDFSMLPIGSQSTQLPEVPLEVLQDTDYEPLPRYWVEEADLLTRIHCEMEYLIGFRGTSNSTNERTVLASVIQFTAAANNLQFIFSNLGSSKMIMLFGSLISYPLDYITRLKIGGIALNFFIVKQLAVLPPSAFEPLKEIKFIPSDSNEEISLYDYIIKAVLELSYTSNSLRPFARSLGYDGNPFIWDEERRFHLRTKLDAIYFHLYLGSETEFQEYLKADNNSLDRYFTCLEDVIEHVMESFPIVKRKDIAQHDSYITKETILKKYQEFKTIIRG